MEARDRVGSPGIAWGGGFFFKPHDPTSASVAMIPNCWLAHGTGRAATVMSARRSCANASICGVHAVDVVGPKDGDHVRSEVCSRFRFWYTASAVPWYHVSPHPASAGDTMRSGPQPPQAQAFTQMFDQ